MWYGYIYQTINLRNGKIYLGQRKGKFDKNYFGSGILINQKIKEIGRENFKVKIITYLPTKRMIDEYEKEIIKAYRKIVGRENIYNISDGGDGGNLGQEVIEKIRKSNTGKKWSEERKKKGCPWSVGKSYCKGKKWTEERREIFRKKMKEDNPSKRPEVREKISKALKGKIVSEETRNKLRLINLGKKRNRVKNVNSEC